MIGFHSELVVARNQFHESLHLFAALTVKIDLR